MHLSVFVSYMVTPVTHRKIEPAVRTSDDPVQVVPRERNPHPEAVDYFFVGIRHPVVIGVG